MVGSLYSKTFVKAYAIHITMNLPASAVKILDAFRGLYKPEELVQLPRNIYPIVHVYGISFHKEDGKKWARQLVEAHLGASIDDSLLQKIDFVRNVTPSQDMFRVSFKLPLNLLVLKKIENSRKRGAEE